MRYPGVFFQSVKDSFGISRMAKKSVPEALLVNALDVMLENTKTRHITVRPTAKTAQVWKYYSVFTY